MGKSGGIEIRMRDGRRGRVRGENRDSTREWRVDEKGARREKGDGEMIKVKREQVEVWLVK